MFRSVRACPVADPFGAELIVVVPARIGER